MTPETINILVSIAVSLLAGVGSSLFVLGRYKQNVDDAKERITELEREVKALGKEIVACTTKLEGGKGKDAYTQRKSPVTLNEKGTTLLKRSGADKFVLDNLDELIAKIGEQSPKTAYDVQELSDKVIRDMMNDVRFNPLKNFAFVDGLEIDFVVLVASLYLRDLALAKLGFAYDDIDKTKPATV